MARVHVVINPASGKDGPILNTLNTVFQQAGIDWDVSITRQAGDAERLARAAVDSGADIVAAYGGDGTVLETATGLRHTSVPLAILPGGTANVISVELGIPGKLADAAALLTGAHDLRPIDMGQMDDTFFFHLGIGFEGQMIKNTGRSAKDRSGVFAYLFSALRELRNPPVTRFHLVLDGETVDVEGINCMVTHYGNMGVAGLRLSSAVNISDGLMDVILIRNADLSTFLSATTQAIAEGQVTQALSQWQVREVSITTDTPQLASIDGELVEVGTEITARVLPGAVQVIVPRK